MPIRVLDDKVVSRIAAGEVVERPAAVVKELLENSLDAGATQIAVETSDAGRGLIRVSDNGWGIPPGEVEAAFKRHATSKISRFEDISSIDTLGFRGEALPSIAAVSSMSVVTAAEGADGATRLDLEGGVVVGRGTEARSGGTTVVVRGLFAKMPARLKFLKTPATENSHIAAVVGRYALAFPEIRFSLLLDGKETLRTSGSGRLIDSIISIYGADIARRMIPLEDANGGAPIGVGGMVGAAEVARSTRHYLNLFVNRRWIVSRALSWAVEEAYHGMIMKQKHPIAIINISVDPTALDVNIHPAKTEVKFVQERAVFSAVQRVVRMALVGYTPVPELKEASAAYATAPFKLSSESTPTGRQAVYAPGTAPVPPTPARVLPALRVLGQVAASFIAAEGPEGLYLIDQHAAHERVLYEQISEQRGRGGVEVQGLLQPVTVEVTPRQAAQMVVRSSALTRYGFSVDPFGERTFLVRSVPALLAKCGWMEALTELMDTGGGDWEEKAAISLACHGAVKAGQVLSLDEMQALTRGLEVVSLPHTCPHGRPTIIHLSLDRLRGEFGRR